MGIIIKMKNKKAGKKEADYCDSKQMKSVISYIISRKAPNKMRRVRRWGVRGLSRNIDDMVKQIVGMQRLLNKDKGRRLYHMIVSFPSAVCNINYVERKAERIADYIYRKYQVVYGIHEDTWNFHIHFVFNAVSYVDGKKFHCNREEWKRIRDDIGEIASKGW